MEVVSTIAPAAVVGPSYTFIMSHAVPTEWSSIDLAVGPASKNNSRKRETRELCSRSQSKLLREI
jgi:hypothetical protein